MSVEVKSALPAELERPIFELAARVDRKSAYSLVHVAKRVKEWIDPIFYSKVFLLDSQEYHFGRGRGPSSLVRFMTPLKKYPSHFFAQHVQHICLCSNTPIEVGLAQAILSQCTNVVTLAYGGAVSTWEHALTLLHSHKLQRLTMELPRHKPSGPERAQLKSLLWNVTHLDILSHWPHPNVFYLLPNLTHFALDFEEGEPHERFPLFSRLAANPRLELVAFIVHSQSELDNDFTEAVEGIQDDRFVPILFHAGNVREEWFSSTSGDEDMWYRAERAIKLRWEENRGYHSKSDSRVKIVGCGAGDERQNRICQASQMLSVR